MAKDKKNEQIESSLEQDAKLTAQEQQAIGASRAAELRERDVKLIEDKEKEKKKEEKNKKYRKWLKIGILIMLILLLIARCSADPVPDFKKDPMTVETDNHTMNVDDIPEETRRPEDDYIFFTPACNVRPTFEDGLSEGVLRIENDEINVYGLQATYYLLNKDGSFGEPVYTSGVVVPGQAIYKDKLDVNLPKGTYDCMAVLAAVEIATNEETGELVIYNTFGAVQVPVTITVNNTVASPKEGSENNG